jgi:uncharacterized protein (DUF2267 family)
MFSRYKMPDNKVPEPNLGGFMKYNQFIAHVEEHSGLGYEQAEEATHAFFEMLGARLTTDESKHLASQLPNELAETVKTASTDQSQVDAGEFFERIGNHQNAGRSIAYDHAQAVWDTLKQAVSKGQINHIREQLPTDIQSLLT